MIRNSGKSQHQPPDFQSKNCTTWWLEVAYVNPCFGLLGGHKLCLQSSRNLLGVQESHCSATAGYPVWLTWIPAGAGIQGILPLVLGIQADLVGRHQLVEGSLKTKKMTQNWKNKCHLIVHDNLTLSFSDLWEGAWNRKIQPRPHELFISSDRPRWR